MKALVTFARTDTGLTNANTTLVQFKDLFGTPLIDAGWTLTELGQGLYIIEFPGENPGSDGVFTIYPNAQPTHVYDGQISPNEDWFLAKSVWRNNPSFIDTPDAPLGDPTFEEIAKTAGFMLDKVGIVNATEFQTTDVAPGDCNVVISVVDLTTLIETPLATFDANGVTNDGGWVSPMTGALRFRYYTDTGGAGAAEFTFNLRPIGGPQYVAGADPVRTITVRIPETGPQDVDYNFMLDDNGQMSINERGLGKWFQRDPKNTGRYTPASVWTHIYNEGEEMGFLSYNRPSNCLALFLGNPPGTLDETSVGVDFRLAPIPLVNDLVELGFVTIREMSGGRDPLKSTEFALWDGAAWVPSPNYLPGRENNEALLVIKFGGGANPYAGGIWALTLPAAGGVDSRVVYVNIPPISGAAPITLFFGASGEALTMSESGFAALSQPVVVEAEHILQRAPLQYGEDPNEGKNLGEQIRQIRSDSSDVVGCAFCQGVPAIRIRGANHADLPEDFTLNLYARKLRGTHLLSSGFSNGVDIGYWTKAGGWTQVMVPGALDDENFRLAVGIDAGSGQTVSGAILEIDMTGADGASLTTAVLALPQLGTGRSGDFLVGADGTLLFESGRAADSSKVVAGSTIQGITGSGFDPRGYVGIGGVTDFTFKAGNGLTGGLGSAVILAYQPKTGEKTTLYTITGAGAPVKDGNWVAALPHGSLLLIRTNADTGLVIDMDSVGVPLPHASVNGGTNGTIRAALIGAGGDREYLVGRDGSTSELVGGNSAPRTTSGDILGTAPGLNWGTGVPARDHAGQPLATAATAHRILEKLVETFLMSAHGWHKDSIVVTPLSAVPPDPTDPMQWSGVSVKVVNVHTGDEYGVFEYRWDPEDPVPAWTLEMDTFAGWPADYFTNDDTNTYVVRVDAEGDFPELEFDVTFSAARGGAKTYKITVPAVTTGHGTEYLPCSGFIDVNGNLTLRGVTLPVSVPSRVWGAPAEENEVAGTMGGKLDTISVNTAGGMGGGAILFTWTEYISGHEGDPDYAIPDVTVVVYSNDSAVGTPIASGVTDEVGAVEFYLDAGTYYLFRRKAGRRFTNPETIVVS